MSRSLHWMYGISIFLLIIKSYVIANFSDDLIVKTKVGYIKGLRADDGNYTMFMGIPYAKVNKSNPFGSSTPQEPFDGIFEAYDDSAMCPQIEEFNFTIQGSLDCLHLNVYVPDSASSLNILPVMVYIHGGGHTIGFAGRYTYGPKYLVRHDVILVTMNYRLGPYGFMCLDTPEVPGNAGLKDQVTALRWIQNNIEPFGGDSNRVTVFGNSAGGVANGLHMMSENEKLFTNVIMQSGTPFISGRVTYANPNVAFALAKALNFATDELNEALNFLTNADVHLVIQAAREIVSRPCVEKKITGVERFLAEFPINSKKPKAANMAVMLGFNSDEMLARFARPDNEGVDQWRQWARSFRDNLQSGFDFDQTQLNELSELFKRFYVGDREINSDVRQEILNYMNDASYVYVSTIRSIERYLEAGVENVFQYVFFYDGNRNFVKVKNNVTVPGAAHADEFGYLFSMGFFDQMGVKTTEEDQLIIDRMTTMWTNFAKYRDPTPETNPLIPVKWEAITKGSPYHYIEINSEMTKSTRYEYRRMTFWDLFYKAYGKYEKGYREWSVEESEESAPDSSTMLYFHPFLGFLVNLLYVYVFIL